MWLYWHFTSDWRKVLMLIYGPTLFPFFSRFPRHVVGLFLTWHGDGFPLHPSTVFTFKLCIWQENKHGLNSTNLAAWTSSLVHDPFPFIKELAFNSLGFIWLKQMNWFIFKNELINEELQFSSMNWFIYLTWFPKLNWFLC